MADRQIYATIAGVQLIKSATYTLTHGIDPGVGVVECFPQTTPIEELGDLTFIAGSDRITVKDCKIGLLTPDANQNGNTITLQILDRRWKWEMGEIYGEYNIYDRKNEPVSWTKVPVWKLMTFCLDAMDETGYDLSKVNNDLGYPHVEWVGANPAKSLKALCDEFGYTIVLHLDGHVSIEVIGVGAQLPNGGEMSISTTINPPERPDSFRVLGAPTRYQALLHLEAVGLDVDGTIKPINDLSYAGYPDINGIKWDGRDPEFRRLGKTERRCAKFSIFRWYRIKVSSTDDNFILELPLPKSSGSIDTPQGLLAAEDLATTVRVKDIREILPISGDLVETYTELGRERKKRARVYGTFYRGGDGAGTCASNSDETVVFTPPNTWTVTPIKGYQPICFQYESQIADFPGVPSNFSINEEFGIVEFPQPVYRKVTVFNHLTGRNEIKFIEADLYVMCSFNWRNYMEQPQERNYTYHRFRHLVDSEGKKYDTGAEIINKEAELQMQIYATYEGTRYVNTPDGASVSATGIPPGSKEPTWHHLRPRSELIRAANHYIDGAKKKYVTTGAGERTYMGLKDIDLDGAIQSVTWSVNEAGPTTRASRNSTPSPFTKKYKFNYFIENTAQLRSDPRAVVPDLPRPDELIRQVF